MAAASDADLFDFTPTPGAAPPTAPAPQGDADLFDFTPSPEPQMEMGQDYPEFDLPMEPKFRQIKTAFGLMTTFSPERQVKVLQANYPELQFQQMADGNILVDGTAYGGNVGYLNKPGVSPRDAIQFAGQAAMFTPAGRAAKVGAGLVPNMGRVGAASAGTQAGMDLAGQATYQTPNVGDIDKTDVGVAAAGGALFEPLSVVAGRILPQFQRSPQITDEVRVAFQTAARDAGFDPSAVTDEIIMASLQHAKRATAGGPTGEFGIRQTRGQASGSNQQLSMEDTLRTVPGTRAQQTMRDFETAQQGDIDAAVTQQQAGMGRTLFDSPQEAAAGAMEGVRERGEALWRSVGEAYSDVGSAAVEREGLQGIVDRIGAAVRPTDFVRDPVVAPSTARAVKDYAKQRRFLARHGDKLKPVHIDTMEAFRRRLRALEQSAGNPNDARQMRNLIRAFDEGMDEAFGRALVSGDEQALESLKTARSLRRRYASLFQRQDATTRAGRNVKDDAGDFIERMMARDPTPQEISNALYGVAKIGAKGSSLRLAQRVKEIVGTDSPEWQAIRQGAFLKLFEPDAKDLYSGAKILSRLKDGGVYRKKDGLLPELFTPQERGTMVRLAGAIKRVQPTVENPPGTATKAAGMINQGMQMLGGSLGFQVGGPAGAAAGVAVVGLAGFRNWLKAARATSDPVRSRPLGGAGAPAALSGREQVSPRTPANATLQRAAQ